VIDDGVAEDSVEPGDRGLIVAQALELADPADERVL